jgi:YjbE family integral membrane protein
MDGANAASTFGVLAQILLLDLLLSGDNALVIALACRRLPPHQARKAAWLGALGAILLRLILTLMTGALMQLPFLQWISALPLLVIAHNLVAEQHEEAHLAYRPQGGMLAAAGLIIVSDATMSLDNVVALAAVSGGSFWLLAFGLVLTIPLIVFGSFGLTHLMKAAPLLVDLGGALLGWVAGRMFAGDPLISGYVARQAPALDVALPLACAIFVLVQGRWTRAGRQVEAPPVPQPSMKPRAPEPVSRAEKAPGAAKLEDLTEFDADAPTPDGDRWMFLGLIALFVIFGLFIGVAVFTTE